MRPSAWTSCAVALPALLFLSAVHQIRVPARADEPNSGRPPAAVESSATATTRLYVKTIPPGAQVMLDGKPLGPSDGLFLVPAGTATVGVQFDGTAPQLREVELAEGRITRLELRLTGPHPADGRAGMATVTAPGNAGPGGGVAGGPARDTWAHHRFTSKRPPVTTAALSKLDAKLLAPTEKMEFVETPLRDALQALLESAGVEMTVDRRSLEDAGIDLEQVVITDTLPDNLSLAAALDAVLLPPCLAWSVRDDIVEAASSDQAGKMMVNHVHDVSDISDANGLEMLGTLIYDCIRPQTWSTVGGSGAIEAFAADSETSLIVSQSWPVQWEVARCLAAYRALKATPVDARRPLSFAGYWSAAPAAVEARAALDKPVNARFNETPLKQAIALLADQAGVPIGFDAQAFADAGLDPHSVPVTLALQGRPLAVVLERLLQPLDCDFTISGERMVVTTHDKFVETVDAAFYPLPAGSDGISLAQVIENTITPDRWRSVGGTCVARALEGDVPCLVVVHDTAGHRAVDALLRSLPKGARREGTTGTAPKGGGAGGRPQGSGAAF